MSRDVDRNSEPPQLKRVSSEVAGARPMLAESRLWVTGTGTSSTPPPTCDTAGRTTSQQDVVSGRERCFQTVPGLSRWPAPVGGSLQILRGRVIDRGIVPLGRQWRWEIPWSPLAGVWFGG